MVSHDFYTVVICADYILFVEDKSIRRMRTRSFRKMIYENHFSKDYLELEQQKKEVETRIEKLLQENELPVTQIAEQCGFNDSNYFSTVFKRVKGMTPQKYRKHFFV